MYTYIGKFENCPELEKIIKQTGKTYMDAKTGEMEIEATNNLIEIKLIFPFPSCAESKD
jgi:hypothetical protein